MGLFEDSRKKSMSPGCRAAGLQAAGSHLAQQTPPAAMIYLKSSGHDGKHGQQQLLNDAIVPPLKEPCGWLHLEDAHPAASWRTGAAPPAPQPPQPPTPPAVSEHVKDPERLIIWYMICLFIELRLQSHCSYLFLRSMSGSGLNPNKGGAFAAPTSTRKRSAAGLGMRYQLNTQALLFCCHRVRLQRKSESRSENVLQTAQTRLFVNIGNVAECRNCETENRAFCPPHPLIHILLQKVPTRVSGNGMTGSRDGASEGFETDPGVCNHDLDPIRGCVNPARSQEEGQHQTRHAPPPPHKHRQALPESERRTKLFLRQEAEKSTGTFTLLAPQS